MKQLILAGIIFMNIYTCSLFYVDKKQAIKQQQKYRISERKLLGTSLMLGGIGAWLGMQLFRHKTKHTRFVWLVPLSAIFTLFAMVFIVII